MRVARQGWVSADVRGAYGMTDELRFDVIAIGIHGGSERALARDKAEPDAEAIVKMAIARLGVENEFYVTRPVWASF